MGRRHRATVRPPTDLAAFFGRLRATTDLESGVRCHTTAFWQRVFDSGGSSRAPTSRGGRTITAIRRGNASGGWAVLVSSSAHVRAGDLQTGDREGRSWIVPRPDADAQRIGIRTPSLTSRPRGEERLSALDATRGDRAVAVQGALSLVARMAAVRSVDPAAEGLVRDLVALRLDDSGYYRPWRRWLTDRRSHDAAAFGSRQSTT
jgi:hypothetical protein